MSNDFDKAVNFLQGALDAAVFESTPEPAPAPQPEPVPEPTPEPAPEPTPEPDLSAAEPVANAPEPEVTVPSPTPSPAAPTPPVRLAASILVAVCMGVAVAVAHHLLPARAPAGIPLDLLPETADASLWPIVSSLHGTIGGAELKFANGHAESNGTAYKVCLDFCRSGEDIYVKVSGNGLWVARLAPDGTVLKAYPARANGKPLKEVFGK